MSTLLNDLIAQSRADAAAYEEFLRKAEALVRRLASREPEAGVPMALQGKREAVVVFRNLPAILMMPDAPSVAVAEQPTASVDDLAALALSIDRVMREQAPAGWKGDDTREKQVKNALFPLLNRNKAATLALFELIKNQAGY